MATCFMCDAPASTYVYERWLGSKQINSGGLYACSIHEREAARLFSLANRDKHLVCIRAVPTPTSILEEEMEVLVYRRMPASILRR